MYEIITSAIVFLGAAVWTVQSLRKKIWWGAGLGLVVILIVIGLYLMKVLDESLLVGKSEDNCPKHEVPLTGWLTMFGAVFIGAAIRVTYDHVRENMKISEQIGKKITIKEESANFEESHKSQSVIERKVKKHFPWSRLFTQFTHAFFALAIPIFILIVAKDNICKPVVEQGGLFLPTPNPEFIKFLLVCMVLGFHADKSELLTE